MPLLWDAEPECDSVCVMDRAEKGTEDLCVPSTVAGQSRCGRRVDGYLFLDHFLNKLERAQAGLPSVGIDDSLNAAGHRLVHDVLPLHRACLPVAQRQHQPRQLFVAEQRLCTAAGRAMTLRHFPPTHSYYSLAPLKGPSPSLIANFSYAL